VTNLLHTYLT